MQFWNELEGQKIEGLYPLHRLIRSEGRSAWFETEAGEPERHAATISLIESLTDADEVTRRLQAAQRFNHPNLLIISNIGRTDLDKTLLVYAILERTDQNLADVLRNQSLSSKEAREAGEAIVAALTAIHRQGLVHGRVEPASVLAVGETIKLRTDCLQSPGASQAGDVAGVGETLFEALTRHKPRSANDPEIDRLPAPFAEIVRNSLSGRWSLAQVAMALKTGAAASQAAVQTGLSEKNAVQPSAKERKPSTQEPASPAVEVEPALPSLRGEATRTGFPMAGYIAFAVGALLILGWLLLRSKPASSVGVASRVPSSISAPPPASAPVPDNQTDNRAMDQPAAHQTVPKPTMPSAVSAHGKSSRTIWRVVAYTYGDQEQAQRKAAEISRAHAELQATVFQPGNGHPVFLVTLGGPMDRDQALKLRDKARSMGFPRDTYAQNFSQ